MSGWWLDLSRREKLLLAVMAASLLLFALYFFGYRGLIDFHRSAARDLARSRQMMHEMADGATKVAQLRQISARQQATEQLDKPVRLVALEQAQAHDITVLRLKNQEDGAVTLWIGAVPSPRLYAWLDALHRDYGVLVGEAIISTNRDAGTVRAQVELLIEGQGR